VSIGRHWVIAAVVGVTIGAATPGILSVLQKTPTVSFDQSLSANPPLASSSPTASATSAPPTSPATATTPPTTTAAAAAKKTAAKKTAAKKAAQKRSAANKAAAASGSTSSTGRIKLGTTYTGNGTFYAATGAGNCSFPASSDRMIGAMNKADYANSAACGAFLAVTGPSGKSITIKIVDQCPECQPGDIDLSAEAFAKLAAPSAGRIRISWHLLSPSVSGPVSYVYKTGSSQYWCGIQVRNHRNPVASLAVLVKGTWKNLPRADYNYFLSADGAGCGSSIRVTDIYGNQVTDTGIAIRPDSVQAGHAQFGPPK
jgi:expansin